MWKPLTQVIASFSSNFAKLSILKSYKTKQYEVSEWVKCDGLYNAVV